MTKSSRKKSNYKKQQYSALNSKWQVGNRRELIDYDYVNKLSPEDKKWLNDFTTEYTINYFEKDKEHLHSKEQELELYRSNNRRNNDVFAIKKSNNQMTYGVKMSNGQAKVVEKLDETTADQVEDLMLTEITIKRYLKKLVK